MAAQYQPTGASAAEISASVERGVRSGVLVAGQPLPPIRELAGTLGLSPATVAAAYRALRQRGIIETAGRAGTRVRSRPPIATSRSARLPRVPPDVLDLSSGEPDGRLLPDLPRLPTGPVGGYHHGRPVPELAELATARLRADGVPVPALAITSGALDGIDRLLSAHLRPGDRVGVEDPGWANLLDLIAAQGLTPVPVPVDEQGPTPQGLAGALAAGVDALVVTSRAHNPTGAALTRQRAAELRSALRAHPDLLLIEDDHSAELSSVALHPLSGATDRWAFLRSTSKPFGPDLRLAVLAGDETTVARVRGRQQVGTGWVSTILQRLVVALWRDDGTSAVIDQARESYRHRRSALRSALVDRGLDTAGTTGINVWLPVPDEVGALVRLRDAGYAVAPGSAYRLASGPGLRITVSRLDADHIERLADAVLAAVCPDPDTGRRV